MADRWYFAEGNQQHGPYSRDQLRQLLDLGLLRPTDLVWADGSSHSIPAADLGRPGAVPQRAHRSPLLLFGSVAAALIAAGAIWFVVKDRIAGSETPPQVVDSDPIAPSQSQPAHADSKPSSEPNETQPQAEEPEKKVAQAEAVPDPEQAEVEHDNEPPGTKPVEPNRTDSEGRVETGNILLGGRGVEVDGPYKGDIEAMFDGRTDNHFQYAKAHLKVPCVIRLPHVYRLQRLAFKLFDGDGRYYRYKVELSRDGRSYEVVADRTTGQWSGWQHVSFEERPVRAIRLTGTFNSKTTGIHILEVEAYCPPAR